MLLYWNLREVYVCTAVLNVLYIVSYANWHKRCYFASNPFNISDSILMEFYISCESYQYALSQTKRECHGKCWDVRPGFTPQNIKDWHRTGFPTSIWVPPHNGPFVHGRISKHQATADLLRLRVPETTSLHIPNGFMYKHGLFWLFYHCAVYER
jgi:hypothetical protein